MTGMDVMFPIRRLVEKDDAFNPLSGRRRSIREFVGEKEGSSATDKCLGSAASHGHGSRLLREHTRLLQTNSVILTSRKNNAPVPPFRSFNFLVPLLPHVATPK